MVHRCTYHIVWYPNYRRNVITATVDEPLKKNIPEVYAERGATIVELETMPDHAHLPAECDPQYGNHRLVKQIKGQSSRLLRAEFPQLKSRIPTPWTNSYFVATIGDATLEVVKRYVENQCNV